MYPVSPSPLLVGFTVCAQPHYRSDSFTHNVLTFTMLSKHVLLSTNEESQPSTSWNIITMASRY